MTGQQVGANMLKGKDIPEEVLCSVGRAGGLPALRKGLPKGRVLREAVGVARGLADETRLRVLGLLWHQPLCVCVIKEVLGIKDSRLSYHLSILSDAGLIERKKDQKYIIYSLTKTGRRALKALLA